MTGDQLTTAAITALFILLMVVQQEYYQRTLRTLTMQHEAQVNDLCEEIAWLTDQLR